MRDGFRDLADPAWRLENLYQITDKNSRRVPYRPNAVQRRIHECPSRRKATLKARQFGVTTDAVLRRFDSCIWNENKTVCILAHKQDVLDKIFNIVKTAYKGLPDDLRPRLDKGGGSKYEMRFPEIGSTIYTTLEVRGGTIHELHVSEAAFIPRERIHATLQAVPLDGIVEFETTPNGLNHFYDFWSETEDGYARLFFPWFFHPDYRIPVGVPLHLTDDEHRLAEFARSRFSVSLSHEQIAFRRHKIKEANNSLSAFLQEYPEDDQTCFLASGSNPFDTERLKARMQSDSTLDFTTENQIRIYEKFDKSKNYVIGADPAEGVRSDFSSAVCFCVETKKEVAFFRSNTVRPEQFAEQLFTMGKLYSHASKWPRIIPERNNHGHAVILALNHLQYPNVWIDPGDDRPGHRTTALTRPLLLDTFIEAVDTGVVTLRSREIFAECLTLVDNGGKIEAESGKHDDCVIAAALGIKVVLEYLPKLNLYSNIESKVFV